MATPGLRLYAREPYATERTTRFDSPLSSRFDESDSLVVLRDVFVPWEHVFVHRNPRLINAQFSESGAQILANHQTLIRFGVKMEFAAGLAIELADAHGMTDDPAGPGAARRRHRGVRRGARGPRLRRRHATPSSAASC